MIRPRSSSASTRVRAAVHGDRIATAAPSRPSGPSRRPRRPRPPAPARRSPASTTEPGSRSSPADERPEGGHPADARATRGSAWRTSTGRVGARRAGVQVVAQHEVRDAGAGQVPRQPGRPLAPRQPRLDRVQHADVRPRASAGWRCARPTATRRAAASARRSGCPSRRCRRTTPAPAAPARWAARRPGSPPSPASSCGDVARTRSAAPAARPAPGTPCHQRERRAGRGRRARRARGAPSRQAATAGAAATAPDEDAGQVRQPQHQRQAQHRVELVHVAQRRQRPVQGVVQRAGQAAPRRWRGGPANQRRPRPAARAPARCARAGRAGTARPGRPPPGPRCRRPGATSWTSAHPAGQCGPTATASVGDPVRRAPQHAEHVGRRGGRRGRLDVVEERRAVPAEQQQRAGPPGGGQPHGRDPPGRSAGAGRGPAGRVSRYSTASGSTAAVATALTPPTQKTASPESAAARRGEPRARRPPRAGRAPRAPAPSGTISTEVAPSAVTMRGASAYAIPATRRWPACRCRSRRARATTPRKATLSSSASHSRWTIHGGSPTSVPQGEERAHREEVAVGLVLHLPGEALGLPQGQRAAQEGQRVDGQVRAWCRRGPCPAPASSARTTKPRQTSARRPPAPAPRPGRRTGVRPVPPTRGARRTGPAGSRDVMTMGCAMGRRLSRQRQVRAGTASRRARPRRRGAAPARRARQEERRGPRQRARGPGRPAPSGTPVRRSA